MDIKEWLTLDNLIKEEEKLMRNASDSTEYEVTKTCRNFLVELKQRRESDIRPADKFLGNSRLEQYMHIQEELDEVRTAMNDYALEYTRTTEFIIMELIDLQSSCETMLAILGLNEQQRMEARCKVIEKNRLRGYYEVAEVKK